jgi:transposase InsO family protein
MDNAACFPYAQRRIVGWAMADQMRTELCLDALRMAIKQRTNIEGNASATSKRQRRSAIEAGTDIPFCS